MRLSSASLSSPSLFYVMTSIPTNASTDGRASLVRKQGVLSAIMLLVVAALAATTYCWLRNAPELWYLRGQRKWLSLVVVSLTSSLTMILHVSWETLMPAMLDAGIFQCELSATRGGAIEALNAIYNVGLGVSAAAQLVEGLAFDLVGPRRLGVSGALASMVGLAMMAWALQSPCNGASQGTFWASAMLVFFAAPALPLAASCCESPTSSFTHTHGRAHALAVLLFHSRRPPLSPPLHPPSFHTATPAPLHPLRRHVHHTLQRLCSERCRQLGLLRRARVGPARRPSA
jgi:hypothetical protein